MVSHTKLRYVVDDIAKDLKQVFDDKIIEKSQIAYWVLLVGNRLKSQHIAKNDSGAYVHAFSGIPLEIAVTGSNPNDIPGRKRIVLPEAIYDYDKDGGIQYISYWDEEAVTTDCIEAPEFTNRTFIRTTPIETERLYMDKYERPSPRNPYYFRQGEFIYFLGIEKVDVQTVEIGIFSTFDPLTDIDLDAKFEFPEELLLILKRQVLDLGRFALKIPEDRKNDGEDTTNTDAVSEQKLVSVNDPINQQAQQ
jgi:hypothetical protein